MNLRVDAPVDTVRRSIRRYAVVAAALYVLDALVFGQGAMTILITLVMVLLGLVQIARGLFGDRSRIVRGAALIGVYVLMTFSVFATIRMNNGVAKARAARIVDGLQLYRARHGAYPASLEQLVPELMPSVPRAKYTVLFGGFRYHVAPDQTGFLQYTTIPPFGRPTYDLKRARWGYID